MRLGALLVLVAACASESSGPECTVDADCGGSFVCARPGECDPPSQVREVTLLWTIDMMPATANTCVPIPNLIVQFDGFDFNDTLGFSPVPCDQGQFHVDKLPTRYSTAELGIEGRGFVNAAMIDFDTNTAQFDLMP